MSELNRQIGDTDNLIRLEKELSKLPDLFRDAGNAAKQSLEDGLVTFLTDGVNEADSLKEALLDLAQTFLKTMQEFFAKQMVTTMMTNLFGHYDTEGSGERNDLFKRATVSQEIPTDDENVKKIVYMSGADHEIVGGDIHYTDENAKATVRALKDEGIIAKLDENGKGYSVPVSSDEASKWYTDYVKDTTVEKGNQTLESIKSEVSQNDNQGLVSAVQDSGNKITSTLTETNAKLDTIHNDLTQGNIEEQENNTEEQANQINETFEEQQQTQAVQSMEVPVEDIDISTERTANNTEGSYSSSISSNGVGISGYYPTLGMFPQSGFGMFSGYKGSGIGYTLGAQLTSILQPITNIITSITDQITGFLNSGVFQRLLGIITGITGSAGVQLAGSIFAIKTLFKGDTKEKLLSMLFLELQLIYLNVSMYLPLILEYVSTYSQQTSVYLAQIFEILTQILTLMYTSSASGSSVRGHATGGYIVGKGTSTSDSIPAMLSNGEFVVKASAVRKYGTGFLNAVNNGNFTKLHMPIARFADGGSVLKEASD